MFVQQNLCNFKRQVICRIMLNWRQDITDSNTITVHISYFQVRKTGKEVWVSLSSALPQIRKEAAGEFTVSHDRAKEPVRAAQVRNDDQPDRGRGSSSKAQRGGGRSGRARRPDSDDLLPVMPEVN